MVQAGGFSLDRMPVKERIVAIEEHFWIPELRDRYGGPRGISAHTPARELDDLGETRSVNRCHALYWERRLAQALAHKAIAGQRDEGDTRPEDLGNIRTALEYSLSAHGDNDLGAHLLNHVSWKVVHQPTIA